MLQDGYGQDYFVYRPGSGGRDSALVVAIHDISRDAQEQAKAFAAACERYGVLLVAPHFAVDRYPNYQRLGRSRHSSSREMKADGALDSILEEVASLTGVSAARIHLFGYAAGGRFAMRYAMGHPDRVAGVVIASHRAPTPFPDAKKSFPQGIAVGSAGGPTCSLELEQFLRVPMTLLEGKAGRSDARLRNASKGSGKTPRARLRGRAARNWVGGNEARPPKRMRARARSSPIGRSRWSRSRSNPSTTFVERGALTDRVFASALRPRCPCQTSAVVVSDTRLATHRHGHADPWELAPEVAGRGSRCSGDCLDSRDRLGTCTAFHRARRARRRAHRLRWRR